MRLELDTAQPGADSAGASTAEARLARLAAAAGPLRRLLAALADRFIARRAHERLCYARLGDYARERLGLSARQLQDLARVQRAFASLPVLERALVANELPWSKVRLVARVATPEDEAAWIAQAHAIPTRRLEQEVRARGPEDPGDDPDELLPQQRVTLRCTPAVAEKWSATRELAERVAGRRLRDADALELVAAEVSSSIAIDPAFAPLLDEPAPAVRQRARDAADAKDGGAGRAAPRALPRPVAALAAGLEDADAFELDRRLRLAVRLEQTLDAALAPLLLRVAAPDYEWRVAWSPLARYAEDQLGMSASKARALLRLERAGDVCPELRAACRSGRLSWVKAQCLLPLLLLGIPGEWRPIWVAWAERVTVRRLEADVARALLLRAGHHLAWQRCKLDPALAQDPIPPGERQLCAHDVEVDATQELSWRLPWQAGALFLAVRETVRARLAAARGGRCTDGEAFEAMLDCAALSWTLRDPKAERPDPVIERDGWRCAVPGCTSRANLHDHHVRFRSAGGSDTAPNRITLCAFHHLRCLHAGILRVQGEAPDGLIFELGLRRGEPPLARYRSGDVELAA